MNEKILDFYKQTSVFTNFGKYQPELVDLWQNRAGGGFPSYAT